MTRKQLARRAFRAAAVASAATLVLTACGSRVDRSAVVSAESGGLADRVAEAQASAAAAAPATTDTGTVAAPAQHTGGSTALDTATAGPAATPTAGTTAPGPGKTTASAGNTPVAAGCAKQGPPVVIGQVGAFSGLVGANN